jgi:hypothetical protein
LEVQVKKILSVSLGSASCDHTTRHIFLGEAYELSHKGTNGDFEKVLMMYREYDGKVDAFGVGGLEFYLDVGERRYYFRDSERIRASVKI